MGVHDEVGRDAGRVERQVLRRHDRADDALLAMAGRKLVPKLGAAQVADQDLQEAGGGEGGARDTWAGRPGRAGRAGWSGWAGWAGITRATPTSPPNPAPLAPSLPPHPRPAP